MDSQVSTYHLVNSLEITKFVEAFLVNKSKSKKSRERLYCRTGNRFLTHLFYVKLEKNLKEKIKEEIISSKIKQNKDTLERIYRDTWSLLISKYDDYESAQLSRLFISLKKIQILKEKVCTRLKQPGFSRKQKQSVVSRKKI